MSQASPDKSDWFAYLCHKIDEGTGERIHHRQFSTHKRQDGSCVHMRVVVWKPPIEQYMPSDSGEIGGAEHMITIARQGFLYWAVDCETGCASAHDFHPLAGVFDQHWTKDADGTLKQVGEVVADNAVTRSILEHLQRFDNEWEGLVGTNSPAFFRTALIECLTKLAD